MKSGESREGMGMIWHEEDNTLQKATFNAVQDRSNLHGLATLRIRARRAQRDHRGPQHHNPHSPPDDGRGDSDSTPVS